MREIDIKSLESSVLGCWIGKNIGGTLGAPFEGKRDIFDIDFYVQKDLEGNPVPNDDLDLQLVWLNMAEYYGLNRLTSRNFGEYWIQNITGPWNEYAVCRWNTKCGFYPPVSGSVDNDTWKWSNGAWIRSEIWACLFPGEPARAAQFAWMDASCDHEGEGIYAELFTASLESLAFVEKDLRKLIALALMSVPEDSRISRSVRFVCDCYDNGDEWKIARNKVMEFNKDLGWFQAPSNVAFAVTGLLYGEGNFGRTICIAAGCGDDTDCTAATAGAVMGILLGAENIPEEWKKPIGSNILTVAINRFGLPNTVPKTLKELTRRVLELGNCYRTLYPYFVEGDSTELMPHNIMEELWKRPTKELQFDVGYTNVGVEYTESPLFEPGKAVPIQININSCVPSMPEIRFRWILPEGWSSSMPEFRASGHKYRVNHVSTNVIPPEACTKSMVYLDLEVMADDREFPTIIKVPLRRKGSTAHPDARTLVWSPSDENSYGSFLARMRK